MAIWKLPPKAKIYEALTAVADRRVRIKTQTEAIVTSSDGTKSYSVHWRSDSLAFGSNDNASFWQGYIGYPIIAVLMELGTLPYNSNVAQSLAGIEWKRLNDAHKRNYDAAIGEAVIKAEAHGCPRGFIEQEVERLYSELRALNIEKLSSARPPN